MSGRKLIIPEAKLDCGLIQSDPEQFSRLFDQQGRPAAVDCVNWSAYPEKPEVKFRIAWCGSYLLLKFSVKEREILGSFVKDGSDVYKDSCVELFLAPEGDGGYFNFEFNCIGCCLAQYGESRQNRRVLPLERTEKIIRIPSLGREPVHRYHEGLIADAAPWSLMLAIPADLFSGDRSAGFSSRKMKGNLYKCGDALDTPHYVSWNPIETEEPDFHRPEFFGELWFS